MRLKNIGLQNVLCFDEHQKLQFSPNFNFIIGANGSGKSVLLKTISNALGNYTAALSRVQFKFPEILADRDSFYMCEYDFESNDVDSLIGLVNSLYLMEEDTQRLVPLVLRFGDKRFNVSDRPFNSRVHKYAMFQHGFDSCLDMDYSKYLYQAWLRDFYFNLSNFKAFSASLGAFMDAIREGVPFISEVSLEERKELYNGVDYCDSINSLSYSVNYAEGNKSSVKPSSEHSHGIKCVVEMVAEIAFRCITLNEHLGYNACRQATGVVMIDDINAYLSPEYQQQLIEGLKYAFPKLQFIVTTDSPFILRGCSEEDTVYKLSSNADVTEVKEVTGAEKDRLVYGDVLDAYWTGNFGLIAISDNGKEMKKRLHHLFKASAYGKITESEKDELFRLQQIFTSAAPVEL